MLGFWIIVTHLVGAYLTSSDYIQSRSAGSSTFAAISSVLYMIPFMIFLPGTVLSFIAVIVFRFLVLRFSIVDYIVWAKNLMAPRDQRNDRVMKKGVLEYDNASITQVVAMHAGSLALHTIFIGIVIIML